MHICNLTATLIKIPTDPLLNMKTYSLMYNYQASSGGGSFSDGMYFSTAVGSLNILVYPRRDACSQPRALLAVPSQRHVPFSYGERRPKRPKPSPSRLDISMLDFYFTSPMLHSSLVFYLDNYGI